VNRRGVVFSLAVISMCAMTTSVWSDAGHLAATRYIDVEDGAIRDLIDRIAPNSMGERDRARAVFAYVRDEIAFGFDRRFHDYRASELLVSRIGYCNTKGTLFTALLRAARIPARQVFVDIDARVLRGLVDPGTPFVDHSYVEAFVGGRWVATDAYIVDAPLMRAAKARLRVENSILGYAAHRDGRSTWDAGSPSFSQFVDNGAARLSSRRWGVYADVGDFYARAPDPWNRLGGVASLFAGVSFAAANRRIAELRKS
jgi:transglutaminase-like putative cysteine protease